MVCPRCNFQGEARAGLCPRCGNDLRTIASPTSGLESTRTPMQSGVLPFIPARGDMLRQGRYHIIDTIALPELQQSQGSAWLALDTQNGRQQVVLREVKLKAAISKLQKKPEQIVTAIAQYLAEIGHHKGLPAVIDMFKEHERYYIVFNHVEGESLAAMMGREGGALRERMVVEYGRQLCAILTFSEQQSPPFVHGSISPQTIMVAEDGTVSLIHPPLVAPQAAVTKNATVVGYLAPEQARQGAVTSSDLYSVAAVLHHAVTGYDPHERLAYFYPPARRLNPNVSVEMEAILSRQLRLSIPHRYANAEEMQRDLEALARSYPVEEEEPLLFADPALLKPAQLKERNRSMRLLNLGIFCAIVVLLLIGVLFAVLRP